MVKIKIIKFYFLVYMDYFKPPKLKNVLENFLQNLVLILFLCEIKVYFLNIIFENLTTNNLYR